VVKCIIFDVDGTLINTEQAILLSLQKTIKEETGRELSLDDLAFTFGIPGKVALEKLEVPDVDAAMARWVKNSYEFAGDVKVFSGIENALKDLGNKGITIGIVTSQARNELEEILKHFGIRDYFDLLVSASDTEKHKPDPEPLLTFLEKAGIDAKNAFYIGDTIYDQQCASGAGVAFALALWGTKDVNMEADIKLESPKDILKFCE
jgi:HAD superfamily hydrolase (TIGR01549 family)